MGIPDGAHTHGSGGGGLGTAVLVIVGAALAVKYAAPVAAAAISLASIVLWAVAIVAGLAAVGLVAFAIYRWRHPRRELPLRAQATVIRAQPRKLPEEPQRAIEQHIHHHWHGVSAEDIAAILARRRDWPG